MKAFNSTLKPGKGLQRKTPMRRAAMKATSKRKHIEGYHDKPLLEACRGESCYLQIPGVCIGGTDTTVPAHSNQARHGKGMGIKAKDQYTVPACYACHAEIDQGSRFTREEKFALWNRAYAAWKPVREEKLDAKPAALTAGNKKPALQRGFVENF